MRSVNVAELKNQLSKYLSFAKGGEEVVIRDRNLPVAKLVPFSAEDADHQELVLVAAGKLRLPKVRLNVKELLKIPTGSVKGNKAMQEVVIRDRNLPVAKLVPFSAEDADHQELVLVAAGKLRLPKVRLNVKELLKIPTGSVKGNKAMQAILADREEKR